MDVSPFIWALTIVAILGMVAFDYVFHVRAAHVPSLGEAARWSVLYVGVAVLFGLAMLVFAGSDYGAQYFAGYVTEKALSVDNLFVFLVLMSSFRVPREDQQKVLLFGILFALVARTGFIFVGAALIERFAWVFYAFGLVLLVTAGNMLAPGRHADGAVDEGDNLVIRTTRRLVHTTPEFHGDRLFVRIDGRRALTPMLLVMIAIGATDVLFALDSIPAIFGLTQETYIVFTATAFSLLGLRQLFFLLEELLDRLVYLSYGLSAILGFIGIKLVLHALHENNLPFINDGRPVPVVEVTTATSLIVIVGVLVVTVLASLRSGWGKALTTANNARRHARAYLDTDYTTHISERRRLFDALQREEQALRALPERYRERLREHEELLDELAAAHSQRDERVAALKLDEPPTAPFDPR
ncbi:MAG: transporter [Thermoleophilia bacterium]|nr:transporter [Thermoleophilia bacterium]